MFGFLRRKLKTRSPEVVAELEHLSALIEKLSIPVVADDLDAGYDMAIDEVLDIIQGRINLLSGEPVNEDDTSGNYHFAV